MRNPGTASPHYQSEIDGLRALAVIAVVLYHTRLPLLAGGYLGVDVFFAISGYVVVGSLQREALHRAQVDWVRFVIRRARRLLPLLWFTVIASLVLAYQLFSPFNEFQLFCKSAIAALGLSANWFFWRFGGSYFGPGIEQSPLLHLWSLSVEEQFYLLLPLVFLAAQWRFTGGIRRLAWWLTTASLALMAWGAFAHPTASFYLPFTRAWEFGVGALAALVPCNRKQHPGSGYALLLSVLLCFLSLRADLPANSLWAGIAALLTSLFLWQSKGEGKTSGAIILLRSPALTWIGQRAYAWYLLHWPAIVFYRSYYLEDVPPVGVLAVGLGSLGLAAIVHRWIEVPCRYRHCSLIDSRFRLIAAATLGTAGLVTALFVMAIDAPERQTQPKWWAIQKNQSVWTRENACVFGGPAKNRPGACVTGVKGPDSTQVFLLGDSHASHLWRSLRALTAQQGTSLHAWSYGGCLPVSPLLTSREVEPDLDPTDYDCAAFAAIAQADVLGKASKHKTIAVLAARWEMYTGLPPISRADIQTLKKVFAVTDPEREQNLLTASLSNTIEKLSQSHVQLILIAPIPEQRVMVPACLVRFGNSERCETSRAEVDSYRASTMKMLGEMVRTYPNVQMVDPINGFCDARTCRVGTIEQPWYVDDDHLSASGVAVLMPQLSQALHEANRRLNAANPAFR